MSTIFSIETQQPSITPQQWGTTFCLFNCTITLSRVEELWLTGLGSNNNKNYNGFNYCLLKGSSQPVQELKSLVYTAAETGAQQVLEMLFTTSAGRIAFDAYKDSLRLPEVVARNCGHEETACYLEDITARYISHVVRGTYEYCNRKKQQLRFGFLSSQRKKKLAQYRESVDLIELIMGAN